MEHNQLQLCFWKKIRISLPVYDLKYVLHPESVLVHTKLFITGQSPNHEPLNLVEYDIGTSYTETNTWKTHPVAGIHPCTDGNNRLYLLQVPEHSDYRYQVIEFSLDDGRATLLDTSGIAPKKRKPSLSCLYYGGCLYYWGGKQIFRGDATGSFVYKLTLRTGEWTQIDYHGTFPATRPHEPFTGCRFGHSTVRFGSKVLVFGGTLVEQPLVSSDCLTSSVLDTYDTSDLHEYDLAAHAWRQVHYTQHACVVPTMSGHAATSSGPFMWVFYEGHLFQLNTHTVQWLRLPKCFKTPDISGTATLQCVGDYLFLFASAKAGPQLYRLNWRKALTLSGWSSFIEVVAAGAQCEIHAHRKVLCKYAHKLKPSISEDIKTIKAELNYLSMNCVILQLYNDCKLPLPNDLDELLSLYFAAEMLIVPKLMKRCEAAFTVTAANLKKVYEKSSMIEGARLKCYEFACSHLREAAEVLAPEQLAKLLSNNNDSDS